MIDWLISMTTIDCSGPTKVQTHDHHRLTPSSNCARYSAEWSLKGGVSQWFQSVSVDCLTDLNCPNFVEVITGMNTVKQFVVQEPGLFPIRYLGLYNSSCKAWGVHSIKGIEFADAPIDLYHCWIQPFLHTVILTVMVQNCRVIPLNQR